MNNITPHRTHLTRFAAGLLLTFVPAFTLYGEPTEVVRESPAPELAKVPATPAQESADGSTATGRVFSVEPETLTLVVEGSTTPVQFQYSKDTPILDEDGKSVSMELIRAKVPLTIHYKTVDGKMVASQLDVTREMLVGESQDPAKKREQLVEATKGEMAEQKRTQDLSPQIVMGTISTVEQTISMQPRGEKLPKSFIINNSTRYINAGGEPVGTELIYSGMPVTIQAVPDGDRMIAQVITVRGNAQAVQSGAGGTTGSSSKSSNTNPSGGNSVGEDGTRTSRSNTAGGADAVIPLNGVRNSGIPATPPTGVSGNPGANSKAPTTPGGKNQTAAGGNASTNDRDTSSPQDKPDNGGVRENSPNPDNKPSGSNQPSSAKPASAKPAPSGGTSKPAANAGGGKPAPSAGG